MTTTATPSPTQGEAHSLENWYEVPDAEEETWIEADGLDGGGGDGRDVANDHNDDDDDDTPDVGDLFSDPDPMDVFTLTYPIIACDTKEDEGGREGDVVTKKSASPPMKNETTVTITLRGVKAENGQTLHSTGLTLWRASPLLCEYLSSNPYLVRGKSVLELGAGLGLCGILTHKLGARRVVLTDGDTDALAEMRGNVVSNVDVLKNMYSSSIECRQLRWGRNVSNFKRRCFYGFGRSNTSEGGTTSICPGGVGRTDDDDDDDGFDVIMGSDIIYVEEILDPLFVTVEELLSKRSSDSPDAMFLLAYARRNVSIDLVFDCANRHGFQWVEPKGAAEGVFVFTRS